MQINNYTIGTRVAEDVIGSIHRASHAESGKTVHVRILHEHFARDAELVDAFHQCAEQYGALQMVECVPLLEHGESDGKHYLILQSQQYRTLENFLDFSRILSVSDAARIVYGLALHLRNAHTVGVVHEVLTPQHVIVDPELQVRILDYKFAPFIKRLIEKRESTLLSSLPYYAPEMLRGELSNDDRMDLFSIGVIFYRALVGHVPYAREQFNDYLQEIPEQAFIPPSLHRLEIPATVDELVSEALHPRIQHRFGSVSQFLDKFLELARPQPPPPSQPPRPQPQPAQRLPVGAKLKFVLLPLVLILLVAIGLITALEHFESRRAVVDVEAPYSEADTADRVARLPARATLSAESVLNAIPEPPDLVESSLNLGNQPRPQTAPAAEETPVAEDEPTQPATTLVLEETEIRTRVTAPPDTPVAEESLQPPPGSELSLELRIASEDGAVLDSAEVYLNGALTGTSDALGTVLLDDLETGQSYLIKVQKPRYDMWAKEMLFREHGLHFIRVELRPETPPPSVSETAIAQPGSLAVRLSNASPIDEVFVYVNGKLWPGPENTVPLYLELQPGEYSIEVRKNGYEADPARARVEVVAGETRTLYFYLEPTNL